MLLELTVVFRGSSRRLLKVIAEPWAGTVWPCMCFAEVSEISGHEVYQTLPHAQPVIEWEREWPVNGLTNTSVQWSEDVMYTGPFF